MLRPVVVHISVIGISRRAGGDVSRRQTVRFVMSARRFGSGNILHSGGSRVRLLTQGTFEGSENLPAVFFFSTESPMRLTWKLVIPIALLMTSFGRTDDPIVTSPDFSPEPIPYTQPLAPVDSAAMPMVPHAMPGSVYSPPPAMSYSPMQYGTGCSCQSGGTAFSGGMYAPGVSPSLGGAVMQSQNSLPGSGYTGGAHTAGMHTRHPYYSYRHSWFYDGPASQQVTIVW